KHRTVTGWRPRHVEALLLRGNNLRLDLVERHRRRIHDAGARWAMGQQRMRNNGACVEGDGAPREDIATAHGDAVGSARSRTDEMNGHGADPVSASAQVAGPTATRGRSSFPAGPPGAR